MESTQTSSTREIQPPIITFLGRPTDSKKGLPLFIEAIQLLAATSHLPQFAIWIIGGNQDEAKCVFDMIYSGRVLKDRLMRGNILIWGRVENSALPELLSRSHVVVMPSYREQFGMVAVEAMQCGCPVVASKVGGLQNLIIPQKTGFLFECGNALSLSAILSGCLRNLPHRDLLAKQAILWSQLFTQQRTFAAIKNLYQGMSHTIAPFWNKEETDGESLLAKETFESKTGKRIDDCEIVHSHGKHHSLVVSAESKKYFVKKVNEAQSCQASVFPIDLKYFVSPKSSAERFSRELFHKNDSMSPQLIDFDISKRILICEYHKTQDINPLSEVEKITSIIRKVRAFAPLSEDEEPISEYKDLVLKITANPDLALIEKFDKISSSINQKITGELQSFTRLHPHVELHRLKLLLEDNAWQLPSQCHLKFVESINYLLDSVETSLAIPSIIHGDLKEGHFLLANSDTILCDWEHSKYCAGPFDEALLAHGLFLRGTTPSLDSALKYLRKLLDQDKESFRQASCWLVAQSIFASIFWHTQGDEKAMKRGYDTLKDFGLLWFKQFK